MKYSILMPYISRPALLHNTLVSFDYYYHSRPDWEVVLIEDPKNLLDPTMHELLTTVLTTFSSRVRINHVSFEHPDVKNPTIAFNLAAKNALGQYFILTSPEVFHQENVLRGLDISFAGNPLAYVICSCLEWQNNNHFISSFDALGGGPAGWYQHSEHRNAKLHFCSAIPRGVWEQLGGFDEDFAYGYGYDDQNFIDRIEAADIPIIYRDDLITLHQRHQEVGTWGDPLWQRNHDLYERKRESYERH